MIKTVSLKKCIAFMAMLAAVLVLSFFGFSPRVSSAINYSEEDYTVAISDISTDFDTPSTVGSWNPVADTNDDNVINSAYAATQVKSYNSAEFGVIPFDRGDDTFAIVKTSEKEEYKNVKISAGFSSPSVTLNKDSFYKITAVINAQTSSGVGGAVFKVTGFDSTLYFEKNKDTVPSKFINTNGNWIPFTLYIATSEFEDVSATVSLLMGDNDAKCRGYAAFDSVYAAKISLNEFLNASNTFNSCVADYRERGFETRIDFESSFDLNTEWDGVSISTKEMIGPNYTSSDANNTVLALETVVTEYDDQGNPEEFAEGTGSIKLDNESQTLQFPKLNSVNSGFHLVSFYALAESVNGETSATLHYKSVDATDYNDNNVFSITSMYETKNTSHYGWTRNYFFVKSSVIGDFEGYLEFAMGSDSATGSGRMYIDDISVKSLTFEEYAYYSTEITSCATVCDFDANLTDADGINGNFYKISTTDTDVLRPLNWTVVEENEDVAYELIDKNAVIGHTFKDSDINNPIGNIVKISSDNDVVYSIKSPAIAITETTDPSYHSVSVLASTDGLSKGTLALENESGATLGTIDISEKNPTLYTFQIKSTTAQTLLLRITLGYEAWGESVVKSSGTIYVARVDFSTSDADAYAASSNQISLHYDSFNDYTLYNKNSSGFIKNTITHLASVTSSTNTSHGIIPVSALESSDYYGKKFGGDPETRPFDNIERVYGLHATNANTTLNFNEQFALTVTTDENSEEGTTTPLDTYYKITISLRAVVKGEFPVIVGVKNFDTNEVLATLEVTDTRVFNEDNQVIKDKFVEYSFYIKLAKEDVNVQPFVKVGGERNIDKADALVYISSMTSIISSADAFDEANDSDELEVTVATKNLNEQDTETGETTTTPVYDNDYNWYLVPSILFGAALIIAIVGIVVKKLLAKRSAKKDKEATVVKKGRPAYSKRIDYSKQPEKKSVPVVLDDLDENEEYDMYAVTEVKAPDADSVENAENAENAEEGSDNAEETVADAPANAEENTDASLND